MYYTYIQMCPYIYVYIYIYNMYIYMVFTTEEFFEVALKVGLSGI